MIHRKPKQLNKVNILMANQNMIECIPKYVVCLYVLGWFEFYVNCSCNLAISFCLPAHSPKDVFHV